MFNIIILFILQNKKMIAIILYIVVCEIYSRISFARRKSDGVHVANKGNIPVYTKTPNKMPHTGAFGYAFWGENPKILLRENLPHYIQRFVLAHEIYHIKDKYSWGGTFGCEFRANVIPGMTDPVGLVVCICATLFSKERIVFYIERIKQKF